MPSRIQSDNVSTTTTTTTTSTPSLTPEPNSFSHPLGIARPTRKAFKSQVQHFAIRPHISHYYYAKTRGANVGLFPRTYFSTGPRFELPPNSFFIAIICHVPVESYRPHQHCVLLKGNDHPPTHSVCLRIINKSTSTHISVPGHCDLYTFVHNPLIQVEVCYIKVDTIPPIRV
jgi:hypothetical protein